MRLTVKLCLAFAAGCLLLSSGIALASGPANQPCVPGMLLVNSKPAGAKVYVAGYFKARTPAEIPIPSATCEGRSYRLTILLDGYQPWRNTIELTSGETREVGARLVALGVLEPELEAIPSAPSAAASQTGPVICIDPGHPSETSDGCTGPTGVTEIHINWVVALKLRDALLAEGYRVVMTKSKENQKVTNRQRAETANKAGAAFMVRLHCDSTAGRGIALYYPDRQGTRFGVTGPSRAVMSISQRYAKLFNPACTAVLRGHEPGRGIHGDSATFVGSKQGALTGSIFARIPVLTAEMVVLTNRTDEAYISTDAGQRLMARALVAGIDACLRAK
jgi:N-acetylmuramoyl-L-alanine amidase